jgi:hypothetical protein
VRLARPDEADFVSSRLLAFAETLNQVGVPKRVARMVTAWPAFAIDMQIDQIFEQTPGPHAGTRLR